jgi:hypothetical protein
MKRRGLSLGSPRAVVKPNTPTARLSIAQRGLPFLFFLLTLAPLLLLLYGIFQNGVEASLTRDINASGSLRYRSLWIYNAAAGTEKQDWNPVLARMSEIRATLRTKYPQQIKRSDPQWQRFARSLKQTGRVSWRDADALRKAANTLTHHWKRKRRYVME